MTFSISASIVLFEMSSAQPVIPVLLTYQSGSTKMCSMYKNRRCACAFVFDIHPCFLNIKSANGCSNCLNVITVRLEWTVAGHCG